MTNEPRNMGQELERLRQAERMAEAMALGDMLVKILTSKPPIRTHWWQFWREKP